MHPPTAAPGLVSAGASLPQGSTTACSLSFWPSWTGGNRCDTELNA